MHSGLILLLWLAAVASVQLLPISALGLAVLACACAALLWARVRAWRLVRRVRILLLAIVVLFAWFTPGEALWVDWPRLGPSREGAMLALLHAGRLLAVVCAVALLLERLPIERLVSGLHALASPLRVLGVPPERLALRLLLVLRLVEASPRGTQHGDWRHWLEDECERGRADTTGRDEGGGDGESVRILRERLGLVDGLVAIAVFAALIWWSVA